MPGYKYEGFHTLSLREWRSNIESDRWTKLNSEVDADVQKLEFKKRANYKQIGRYQQRLISVHRIALSHINTWTRLKLNLKK